MRDDKRNGIVDEAGDESFPASDPPGLAQTQDHVRELQTALGE